MSRNSAIQSFSTLYGHTDLRMNDITCYKIKLSTIDTVAPRPEMAAIERLCEPVLFLDLAETSRWRVMPMMAALGPAWAMHFPCCTIRVVRPANQCSCQNFHILHSGPNFGRASTATPSNDYVQRTTPTTTTTPATTTATTTTAWNSQLRTVAIRPRWPH